MPVPPASWRPRHGATRYPGTQHTVLCAGIVFRRHASAVASKEAVPQLVATVRRSVPSARHTSSVEGVRRARLLHGHGASRADHPRRSAQLGAAISALEWVAHATHSP